MIDRRRDLVFNTEVMVRAGAKVCCPSGEHGNQLSTGLLVDTKLCAIGAFKLVFPKQKNEGFSEYVVVAKIDRLVATAHFIRFLSAQQREHEVSSTRARTIAQREEEFGIVVERVDF